ncbi:MAG TPA: NADH-quinone oxidoreductase subunit L [Anaerolineaceae bacterium]|nr:NADH-quinone oxidoreductase subunit L [Anaerolineaceae bacterium]
MTIETLLWLIPLPPLLAFALIILFTNRQRALSHTLAVLGAFLSWLAAMIVFLQAIRTEKLGEHPLTSVINWLPTGGTWFQIGVQVDPLSAVTLFFVAWTVLMIFIYSVGYHNFGQPEGDHDQKGLPPHGATVTDENGHPRKVPSIEPMYARFFAFISLFAFAMYLLVVSDNLLTLYVGWEIMGLCSYLLIGFWYAKKSARDAAMKAFVTTRIGDVFMLLGLAYLYTQTGTLNYHAIFNDPAVLQRLASSPTFLGLSVAGAAGLLLFIGTVGKSAQFPLHVWLPDAMEGPTPVSAMIHAATMVSAGVYLAIRIFPLISYGWQVGAPLPPAMSTMTFIGAFSALFAATIAVAQNDIKRVLAYSTISQLGYMIAALGVGAYGAAIFHLFTHAFFKALLFLGSGLVIHGMEHGILHTGEHIDPQDMLNMGGLRKRMPVTFLTFLAGGLSLSGFPLITAGFWSKDAILEGAFSSGHVIVFLVLALSALLTAFYTMRQITLAFLGQPRTNAAAQAVESRRTMVLPLVVLSVFAIGAGWVGIPQAFPGLGALSPNWFEEFVSGTLAFPLEVLPTFNWVSSETATLVSLGVSLVVSLGGLFLGWLVYRRQSSATTDPLQRSLGAVYIVLKNKYFVDEAYQAVFVRPSYWLAETFTSKWMDQGVIDGFLHALARGALGFGNFLRNFIDLPLWNRAFEWVASRVVPFGQSLRPLQSGKVQQYLVAGLLATLAFAALFYFVIRLAFPG